MLILEITNLIKEIGDRKLFEIEKLRVYSEDRIGIVGKNGEGKTTLLNIISGRDKNYSGNVRVYGNIGYIQQLGDISKDEVDTTLLKKYGLNNLNEMTMSGGEKTKLKIASTFSRDVHLIMADEPTCNLDINSIEELERKLKQYKGALIIISHDKTLLNNLCNSIIEIENGKVTTYTGNYGNYKEQKEEAVRRQQFKYDEYVEEKKRLTATMLDIKKNAASIKLPARMGNSEARLHKGSLPARAQKLERIAKVMEKRISNLEKVDKPYKSKEVKISIPDYLRLETKYPIKLEDVSKSFGKRMLFKARDVFVQSSCKTAIIGSNGTGKTTLINMIINRDDGINISPSVKIGYFCQVLNNLKEDESILDNVMSTSVYSETITRIVLGNLLFRGESVLKPVSVLSGGERVKVSFAKVFLSEMNLLILDEPTNFLDIESKEALINVLQTYDGTVLFVSHDRDFINEIADNIISIEDNKITHYAGNYDYYLTEKNRVKSIEKRDVKQELMQLELRLNNIIGRLSTPSKNDDIVQLDIEYRELLEQINGLKNVK